MNKFLMKFKEKCIKSSYVFKNKITHFEIAIMFILSSLLFIGIILENSIVFLIIMGGISLTFVAIKHKWILNLAKANDCILAAYSKK